MTRARFVHGTAAGQEIDVNGPRHRVTKLRNAEFQKLGYPLETVDINDAYEEYDVHQFKFATGHEHNYAAPVGVSHVGIFNELWHGYRVTQSLSAECDELKSQNERLKQELWREKFRNQFGEYP